MSTPYTQLPSSGGYPNQYPPMQGNQNQNQNQAQGYPQYAPPNQYAPPYPSQNQNQAMVYTAIPVTGTPLIAEQKQVISTKHKVYLVGYFCVWILTIVAVGLPTWKKNYQDVAGFTKDIEIGLWKWTMHSTSPGVSEDDSYKVNNHCKFDDDETGTEQDLLSGGACSKYDATRAMAVLKIIFGGFAILYGLVCIAKNRPHKFRFVRTLIFIGAIWGLIGINLFRSIGNGEWFDGAFDDGWSNGHGWVLLTVASILSILLAVFYRCLIRTY